MIMCTCKYVCAAWHRANKAPAPLTWPGTGGARGSASTNVTTHTACMHAATARHGTNTVHAPGLAQEMDVEEQFLLRSWDGNYSGSYGSMQDFLAAHDDVFGCT